MFKGTYYKHQINGKTVCFIAGKSTSGPFVQVITNETVYQFNTTRGFHGSRHGIIVDLPGIKGRVAYHNAVPLQSDIMGPFRYLPMQCRHAVYSMRHTLRGSLRINGEAIDFTGGTGYIEGDSGRSFPQQYLWLHCNDFITDTSIMLSVAQIPFTGFQFWGCICAIVHGAKQYRLATYHGVKILTANQQQVLLQQGRYKLSIAITAGSAHPLYAPQNGQMVDIIRESNNASARFRFWENDVLLFDLENQNVSFECNLEKPLQKHSPANPSP